MPRNRTEKTGLPMNPEVVFAAVMVQRTSLPAQVLFELDAIHTATGFRIFLRAA